VKAFLLRYLRHPRLGALKEAGLFVRGLLFLGRRYQCPCCGWRVRAFAAERSIIRKGETGYCPRCNAKARHRRIWLFLKQNTELFSKDVRLLEVAPWWAFARRFRSISNICYVGLDLRRTGPHVTTLGDAIALPLRTGSLDAAICVHVLEHIEEDRGAIAELYRVLKPGGWSIITVPLRLDRPTQEDPAIRDPIERARLFGEPGHVRFYGTDLVDRIRESGFDVTLDLADSVPADLRRRHGLRDDENIFYCRKPL